MSDVRKPGLDAESWDPLPSVAEMDAQFEGALAREVRPFFALAGLPTASARWSQRSVWSGGGEGGDPGRAFVLLVIRYGDDTRWASVGTRFGQLPRQDGSDEHREAMVYSDMASELGIEAAETLSGEAYTNGDAMWARVQAAQAKAENTVAGSLIVDGHPVEARTAQVDAHQRTSFYVPVGGVAYLHTCRWDGPAELRRAFDYGAISREDDPAPAPPPSSVNGPAR